MIIENAETAGAVTTPSAAWEELAGVPSRVVVCFLYHAPLKPHFPRPVWPRLRETQGWIRNCLDVISSREVPERF